MGTVTIVRSLKAALHALPGRLLRLELRRNATWLMLPLLAVLLWQASAYGRALRAPVVLWSSRSVAMQGSLQVIGPFAAGMAAWTASREARRHMTDLLASTALSLFFRRVAVLVATACCALALYAAAGVVLFVLTAREATWGGPVWWPVAVGAAGVVAFTASGSAIGAAWPSPFTAPLLAFGLLLALQISPSLTSAYSLISPARDSISQGASVFFGVDPGLAMTQIIFLCGLTVAALAAIAVPARFWRGRGRLAGGRGRPARGMVAAVAAAGILAGTGVALAGTARDQAPQGTVIPWLHNAASDNPVAYTLACDNHTAIPVCVHPAYRSLLPVITADIHPLTSQVAGIAGAPARIDLAAPGDPGDPAATTIAGNPPIVYLGQFINTQGPMTAAEIASSVRDGAAHAITGLPDIGELEGFGFSPAQSAQAAVSFGLLNAAGDHTPAPDLPAAIAAAAHRFAALTAQTRHDWLAAHLLALRAGHLNLAQLP